jgi:methionyl-tRNA formyltransferase
MKVAVVGSKFFGASVLAALQKEPGVTLCGVVAPAADDRLALAAQKAGIAVHVQPDPRMVEAEAIPMGTDVIIAAHTHARVSNEALARARLGGVGYHPSLLPRHRGIAAVEWTILSGDPIAGGSVYHLADGWDKGGIALQDWCFVARTDDARSLWERSLSPMGLALLRKVVAYARDHDSLPSHAQDESFATKAPMIRRTMTLTPADGASPGTVSLAVTVMGPDRPGIVNLLSDRARRFGANWTASRMANLAGEFAGMVQLEVSPANVAGLTVALRDLESTGLKVAVSQSAADTTAPAGLQIMRLDLTGDDQVGIVSKLAAMLAERNVSIEQLDTEVVRAGDVAGKPVFKVRATLRVPRSVAMQDLRVALDSLASELMLDVALGD